MTFGKRIAFWLMLVGVAYGLVEGAAYVAYKPLTGRSFGEATENSVELPESLNVRSGREQAGLGFRDPAMSLHPYLGYVYTPPEPGAEPGRVSISQDGFLDTGPAVRKRNDSRVLVGIMGGSVAGQLGTWHSERLHKALSALPRFQNRAVEFIKLGLPGYHQPQQLQQLSYILAQGGEFDIILNIDGFNEVAVPGALNVPKGAHPLFPMNWSMVALDVPDPDVRRHVGAVTYLREERQRRKEDLRASSVRSRSILARLLWQLEDNRINRTIADHAWQLQEFPVDEIPYFVRGPEGSHDPPGGLMQMCVDIWKRSSLQMQALCDANDIQYYHFLQPNQYVANSKTLSSNEKKNAYDEESPYRPVVIEGYPLLQTAGRELSAAGVNYHDLTLIFQKAKETLYADTCCHFNAEGNQIMSDAIARALSL